jgi:hypothetical protein
MERGIVPSCAQKRDGGAGLGARPWPGCMGEDESGLPTTVLDDVPLLLFVLGGLVVAVVACKLTAGGGSRTRRRGQTVEEVEESTPLLESEAQQYINKVRKEMGSSGIQLGGEFEYRLAQAHLKAKREKEAQGSGATAVRQRVGRDPRTAAA